MLKIADSVDCAEVEIMNPYASYLLFTFLYF